jgi:hypothetical protein
MHNLVSPDRNPGRLPAYVNSLENLSKVCFSTRQNCMATVEGCPLGSNVNECRVI